LQNLAPAPSLPLVLKGKLFVRPTSSMEHCIDSVTTCRRGTCASNAEQSPRPCQRKTRGRRAAVATCCTMLQHEAPAQAPLRAATQSRSKSHRVCTAFVIDFKSRSPGADVAGVSPGPSSSGADAAGVGPVPAQMWRGRAQNSQAGAHFDSGAQVHHFLECGHGDRRQHQRTVTAAVPNVPASNKGIDEHD
jgi:hypothetical protein